MLATANHKYKDTKGKLEAEQNKEKLLQKELQDAQKKIDVLEKEAGDERVATEQKLERELQLKAEHEEEVVQELQELVTSKTQESEVT